MKLQQATVRHLSLETLLVRVAFEKRDLPGGDSDIRAGECLGTERRKKGREMSGSLRKNKPEKKNSGWCFGFYRICGGAHRKL